MNLREAVEIILAGYGDDCPSYGDDYLAAMLTLADHGLVDWPHPYVDVSCKWPQPELTATGRMIVEMYRDALAEPPMLLQVFSERSRS